MTKHQHFLLIALFFFLYTFLGTVPKFYVTMNYVSWFCALYVYSSFMRLYDFPFKDNHLAWRVFSLTSVLISIISVLVIRYYPGIISDPYWFVSDSNKFMALITAICLFNLFRTLRMPYNRLVNILGSTTFGVLLIHAHSNTMRSWLWGEFFDNVGHLTMPYYALRAFGVVVLVFAVCSCIDYLRIKLLERPLFTFYDNHFGDC